ncbi:MAG: ABC transporter permease subunit [Bordetella sp.]|nr:MAG: ABC transporter permease subunit [Bordetella sp.]
MNKLNKYLHILILFLGYSFLYVPLINLIIFSFNDASIVTSWTGFSFRWYICLYQDKELLQSAKLSLEIAILSATAAVIIGTWASYVLIHVGRFRGFQLYLAMLNAPLVIPDVVLGIALLLMFIEIRNCIGWPFENGFFTIWIGHIILCIAFVSVIVQARVHELDSSLEEAALDLGAKPLKVFFNITLPLIYPALLSAWLLSFTLSLDDVVVASFLSGPGATTLPMTIFSRVRLGLRPEINALATIFIFLVAICVILASQFNFKFFKIK